MSPLAHANERPILSLTPGLALALFLALPIGAHAQQGADAARGSAPPGFKAEFLGQFGTVATRLVDLARAMPADTYDWRPMEGVASVADAYMHIARYNYYYPDVALGVEPPADVDYESLEGVVTAKEEVVPILERSLEHVRRNVEAMTETELNAGTRLYGRDVAAWSVLLQLLTHMNQHYGQEIAYARVNGVVPPWSR